MLTTATLTQKQQRFVAEYLVDGNGSRAAIAAGYRVAGARVRAHRLTRDNEAVQAEIRARQALDSQRLRIDREGVIAGLLAGIELAKARLDGGTVIKGWAELGKLMGYYQPQRHQVQAVSTDMLAEQCRFEHMTDSQLLAAIKGTA